MGSVDRQETHKFKLLADEWWDENGSLKTLHDINSLRLSLIKKTIALKGMRGLDVGCGGGILTESLADAGALMVGIDAEETVIKAAMVHAKGKQSLAYHCCPIEDFNASPFDFIACMELLEHVNDPLLIINHADRLLRPEGFLFLSTLNRNIWSYMGAIFMAEYVLKLLPQQTHDYERLIKPSELAHMVRLAGLDVVSVMGLTYNPITRQTGLTKKPTINYLMICQKPF